MTFGWIYRNGICMGVKLVTELGELMGFSKHRTATEVLERFVMGFQAAEVLERKRMGR
mgnify:CR=1 FL=1|jgi:hypothetical protein